jgi:oxygen-independent coproporphyrinogen-3 oxidase
MDHFAISSDKLYIVSETGDLHRNFMGYTDQRTDVLLGMGVSAISEAPTCFHQNEKVFTNYEKQILDNRFPTLRGHLLNEEDRFYREKILKMITRFEVLLEPREIDEVRLFLRTMIDDGLVKLEGNLLKMTSAGRPFLRNVCMVFDVRLRRNQPHSKVFSQAI